LVWWDQVTLPFEYGGISIHLPNLTNKALGIKLVWRRLIGQDQWWGDALARKYLNGQRSLLINGLIPNRPCTQIWRLIKKSIPHIKDHLSKNPGNGENTSIRNDRIMGAAPLKGHHNLNDLHD